jgi:hypothetical protein
MATRKYISEFGLNMMANQILILQQTHMAELTEADFEPYHQCHVYAVARRPRISLDPASIVISPETFRASCVTHRRGEKAVYDFEFPNNPKRRIAKCECEYPYADLRLFDANNDLVLEGSVAQWMVMGGAGRFRPELVDLEILYIGQAYGADGQRTAPKRLRHHETLQMIYAEAIQRSPDMDIWLALFSFEEMMVASFDGRSGAYDTTEDEDLAHMYEVLGTPMTEKQRINYTEAALIRYFRPPYNSEFKDNFPNPAHVSYSECYELDLNSVMVEVNTGESGCNAGCNFWSEAAPAQPVHLVSFQLHSAEERRAMFELAFGPDAPDDGSH